MFYFWYSFFPIFHAWITCIVLFTVCAVLWLFTVRVICSTFSTSFTYWRFGAFFSVVLKSLALVTSEWVWEVHFDFKVYPFLFQWRFLNTKAVNICICLDYFVIAFLWKFFSNILGAEGEIRISYYSLWGVQGVFGVGLYFKIIKIFLF